MAKRSRCLKCNKVFYSNISAANGHSRYCTKKCMNEGPSFSYPVMPVKRLNRAERLELDFYNTQRWLTLRFEAFQKFGRICMCCGAKPPKAVIHVDHIKPRSKFPELALSIDNLQILCSSCNLGKGSKLESDFRPKI